MTDQEVDAAVALALNPEEGRPFTFGDRAFRLQFLTYDGEQALVGLLMPRIQSLINEGRSEHNHVMAAIRDLLPEACGIILSDQDPASDVAWVRSVRAKGVSLAMYDIVTAQFEMNDLGKLLSGLLQTDALLQAASRPAEA